MIITRLVGGLGNQMFEYASAYAIARENNTELFIDPSWYEEKNSTVWTMGYALDNFTINKKVVKTGDYTVVAKINLLSKFKKNAVIEYKEKSLLYDQDVFKVGKDLVIDGYWQSERYFIKYRKEILEEFTFKEDLSTKNQQIIDLMKSTTSVSLHVRRGDYANHAQTNAFHGLMPIDYYREAIKSISDRVGSIHIFIFSDEPEWCEANLKFDAPQTVISGNQGYEDMKLMSSCKHHILANSSFSWWGAWLNPNDDKIVIAPKKWFNNESQDSKDLVPQSWERI